MASNKKNSPPQKRKRPIKKGAPKTSRPKKTAPLSEKEDVAFYIVGMGASAGGLEAFEKFFQNLPKDPGMAFVLVTHLDPTHMSILPELLQKYTDMEVLQIKDGIKARPNKVFVAPPGNDLAILQGTFNLIEPTVSHVSRMPINYFLRTLAQDQRDKAICIILSGMGTDGTLGLRDIKGELGMTMAQDETSAKYDGMPKSAIDTGLVDYVLPVEGMPDQLIKYTRHAANNKAVSRIIPTDGISPGALQKIFILLRTQTGHDFSNYKPTTISRRIERRMNVHQMEDLSHYFHYLQRNPLEVTALFKELLIGVTSFFRESEAFKALREKALLELIAAKPDDQTFRAWVTGCSSGEEAYSVAILIKECLIELNKKMHVQIFATDIDGDAIEAARVGSYPESIAVDVDPNRLKQFFRKENGVYMIKKEIREMVVFATQDVLKDPPLTKLDLICCRNLLIYLNTVLQKRLFPLFHYSLRSGGILFLGTSETISGNGDLFSVVDKKWKIYQRNERASDAHIAEFPISTQPIEDIEIRGETTAGLPINQLAPKLLMDLAPTSALVDSKGAILFIHGRTGNYLEPTPGEAKMNILEMAREGLRVELPAAIRKAVALKQEIACKDLEIKTNGETRVVNIMVRPVKDARTPGLLWVIFEEGDLRKKQEGVRPKRTSKAGKDKRLDSMEDELRYTRETLQTTIEELEAANEELKSTNEELQSTNEELQSANEELETSKEEQQSLNEELVTVNSELQGKIEELTKTNNDMRNLLDSMEVPTVFLDSHLCITRYTHHVTRLFHVIESDIGRPITHVVSTLKQEGIEEEAEAVLKDLIPRERECESKDGHWYSMRVLPYRTMDNVIDGVVIAFLDIHEQKRALEKVNRLNEALQEAREYSQNIVETLHEAIVVLDNDLKVISANRSFYRMFQSVPEATEGRFLHDLGNKQWNIPKLRELLEEIIPKDHIIEDFEVEHDFHKVGHKRLRLNARRMIRKKQGRALILLAMEDVTG